MASSNGSSTGVGSAHISQKGNTEHDVPMSPRSWKQPVMRKTRSGSIDLDDYFVGPRNIDKHSKWPYFMRLHGSVMPKMILPLFFVGCWATLLTVLSEVVPNVNLAINNVLLTILGFVVAMAINFRTSTAYERYAEGRKYWSQLTLTVHNIARVIWVQTKERDGEQGKEDLLGKLTGMNLLVAFAVALKHKLRFEPGIEYEDLAGLVAYLDTFARAAEGGLERPGRKNVFKSTGEYLGVSFAESNPRKYIKKAKKPLGNLPLEILNHLSAYIDKIIADDTLKVPIYQTHAVNGIHVLNEVLTGTERVLNTPLPIAYSIAISQITWVYVMVLPFQLIGTLNWITIPGTIVAAYIILGIAAIGREIENPFGNDVNDLPLDSYCEQLQEDIDILCAAPAPVANDFIPVSNNKVLFPLSYKGCDTWKDRTKQEIRDALMTKSNANLTVRRSMAQARKSEACEDVEKQHGGNNNEPPPV